MNYVSQDGTFQARVLGIGAKTVGTETIIQFDLEVVNQWDPANELWVAWPADYRFQAEVWLTKDGQPEEEKVSRISAALGWNGDFKNLFGDVFAGVIIQSGVAGKKGKDGKTYYRGSWVDVQNAPVRKGSSLNASPDLAASLAAQFNGFTKSIASQNGIIAPHTPPPAPAAPAPVPTPVEAPVGMTVPAQDNVPF